MGIGRPPGRMDVADYVLQNFSKDEMKELSSILDRAADAVLTFVKDGLDKAMNKYNGSIESEVELVNVQGYHRAISHKRMQILLDKIR